MVLRTILALLLALPATAQAAVFNPHTTTLPNGLHIIVVENHRAPVVLHMLWYKVGSADEKDPQVAGLAHFLEHMMFKGTAKNPDQDFSAAIDALGGEDNAFTGPDYTAFFQRVHPSQLKTVMTMEAERITGLELNANDINVEKSVVTAERAQVVSATPESRWGEAANTAYFGTHPYARPVIGFDDTIARFDAANVRAFYEQHYAPNNAILVVSGDVKADDVFAMATDIYGALPTRVIPPRGRDGAITATPQTVAMDGAQQPQLQWRWPAPSARTATGNDDTALQVLVEMLGAPDALLQQTLMHDNLIAVGLDVSYDDSRFDDSVVSVGASPAPTGSLDALSAALTSTWPQALAELSDDQLTRAKQRLIDAADLAADNIHTPAYAFGITLTTGGSIDDVEMWPEAIAAVTMADIQRVAKLVSGPPRLVARLEAKP